MSQQPQDEFWMQQALAQAHSAALIGEVPVGAVLVQNEQLVSAGYNRRETDQSSTAHAEIIAIEKGCKQLGRWRLESCTLYITLEPCPMCCGAIINARIPRVVFGAFDPKAGCLGSVYNFNTLPFNHKPAVTSGVLAEESARLLREFFRSLRSRRTPKSEAIL